MPRCLGGSDESENIVSLTPECHYVAHQLLVKMYPGHAGLAYAAMAMSKKCTGNKPYGWLRRRFGETQLGKKKSTDHRQHIAEAKRGVPRSAETKAKLSAAFIGKRRAPFSDETRARMSASLRGRPCSPETRAKMSEKRKGIRPSFEARRKMSDSRKGRVMSAEARAKRTMTQTGRKRPPFSAEWRANIAAANRGRKRTPETRAKMSVSSLAAHAARRPAAGVSA